MRRRHPTPKQRRQCLKDVAVELSRKQLEKGDEYHHLIHRVMDGLVQIFPMAETVAIVLEPCPGLPAVVIPIVGDRIPGIVGLPDVTYTG